MNAVVLSEIDARGVATVTLNRPDVNNAYNAEVVAGLEATFTALAAEARVRLVLIRGNGKHFQAGADLRWLREIGQMDQAANLATSRRTAGLIRALNEFPKPTVGLIHGACIGGGTGIAAACDIVIASRDAVFAITEARWGVVASVIFPQLIAAMGERNVRRYALTCERFDAVRAKELGLVHEVCEPGELDSAAQPVIEGLLAAGPDSVLQTKRGVLSCAGSIMSDALFDELSAQHAAKRQSTEAHEGLMSFIEKRTPAWYPAR